MNYLNIDHQATRSSPSTITSNLNEPVNYININIENMNVTEAPRQNDRNNQIYQNVSEVRRQIQNESLQEFDDGDMHGFH